MYLRKNIRVKDGKEHIYWSIIETVRTKRGPRQQLVCHLGELNTTQENGWRKTIKVLNRNGEEEQLQLFPAGTTPVARDRLDDPCIVTVDLATIRLERAREFGTVWVGWQMWQRLGLDAFFQRILEREGKNHSGRHPDVPYSLIAAILAINRLVEPRSELFIEEQWYKATALADILGVPEEKIHTDRLYACLDALIRKKDALEMHLKQIYADLFSVTYDLVLYDLTSTYFEGKVNGNSQAKRGYSRDHRPDCKQVLIALVVSPEGFPFSYEVFDGNRPDVTTLEDITNTIEKKYGKARRIWVFDRGIVSEDNLEILRERGASYLVGARRNELKRYEQDLHNTENWQQVKDDVVVKLIPRSEGNETFVVCRSQERGKKEEAMRESACRKLEQSLERLSTRIKTGKIHDRQKVERAIGSVLGRYPSVADLYTVTVENGQLLWKINEDKQAWCVAREGAYLLRTNVTSNYPQKLWYMYMQLVEAEAAFRSLKSELVIRPIWHQKEKRVQAHIMVAFLGYALWVTLKHTLKRAGTTYSPWRALNTLKRIHSGDIVMKTVGRDAPREIRLRRVFAPDTEQRVLLAALNIPLPKKLAHDTTTDVVET